MALTCCAVLLFVDEDARCESGVMAPATIGVISVARAAVERKQDRDITLFVVTLIVGPKSLDRRLFSVIAAEVMGVRRSCLIVGLDV